MAALTAAAATLIAVTLPAHASTGAPISPISPVSAAKATSPSGTLITQINAAIHKEKGLGKGASAVQVSTYAVAPSWVITSADSKKYGPVDVLLQFSGKKWHVKDYGTASVGCGVAPKKLLKAMDQDC